MGICPADTGTYVLSDNLLHRRVGGVGAIEDMAPGLKAGFPAYLGDFTDAFIDAGGDSARIMEQRGIGRIDAALLVYLALGLEVFAWEHQQIDTSEDHIGPLLIFLGW